MIGITAPGKKAGNRPFARLRPGPVDASSRRDDTAERALFLVDKKGVIRFIDVHDSNFRPDLGRLVKARAALSSGK